MSNPESNPEGDWTVDIDEEAPDHVKVQFCEWDENGAVEFVMYLCPHSALDFAKAIEKHAQSIINDE